MTIAINLTNKPDWFRGAIERATNERRAGNSTGRRQTANGHHAGYPTADAQPSPRRPPLEAQKVARCYGRPVSIRIHCRMHRLRDSDGNFCKYLLDSLVSVGLLEDDGPAFMPSSPVVTQEKIQTGEQESVTVTVEEI